MPPRTISLQVPPDATAGDALTFCAGGQEIEIPVPEGSQPGDVLEIQVDVDAYEEEEAGAENTVVELALSSGKTLRFDTVLPPERVERKGCPAKEKEGSAGIDDGTYAHPWPSGMAMAKYWGLPEAKALLKSLLSKEKEDEDAKRDLNILELGSGLGLVGIAFGAQYAEIKDGALPAIGKLVLSDVQDGMALLQHNLHHSKPSLLPNIIAKATPLLWTEEASDDHLLQKDESFDLMLASDVIYNTESIPALVATLKRYLQPSTPHLLFAARWRKPELERAFFEALEGYEGKQWHLVHAPSSCPLSWKDYGNPNCEASNKYFHQTMVSVQGKPHSLAQIMADNNLQQQMMDPEADAFENCHIQIYCLTNKNVESESMDHTKGEKQGQKRPREDDAS